MDWFILIWTIFVAFVYIGGYFLPSQIGIYTTEFSKIYALVLIGAIAVSALNARSKGAPKDSKKP